MQGRVSRRPAALADRAEGPALACRTHDPADSGPGLSLNLTHSLVKELLFIRSGLRLRWLKRKAKRNSALLNRHRQLFTDDAASIAMNSRTASPAFAFRLRSGFEACVDVAPPAGRPAGGASK
jgi:hypothetical protein